MWFPTGCYYQIQKWFEERLHFVGIAGFVVAILQVEKSFKFISTLLILINIFCISFFCIFLVVWTRIINDYLLCGPPSRWI